MLLFGRVKLKNVIMDNALPRSDRVLNFPGKTGKNMKCPGENRKKPEKCPVVEKSVNL